MISYKVKTFKFENTIYFNFDHIVKELNLDCTESEGYEIVPQKYIILDEFSRIALSFKGTKILLENLTNDAHLKHKEEFLLWCKEQENECVSEIVSFETFIELNDYKLDIQSSWYKEIWSGMVDEKWRVHVSPSLLEWMGYEGKEKEQKKSFKKLVERNSIPFEEIYYDDLRVQNYPSILEELHNMVLDHNTKRKKFMVMSVDDFKEVVMMLNTKVASKVRKYYIHLEKAVWRYQKYMNNVKNTQLQEKSTEVKKLTMTLRSESQKHKEQLKKVLEFSHATRKVEPLEYIYICTTEKYQKQNKFKVGGVGSFDLLKSRLSNYNSGKSKSDSHFFVFVEKTVSYRAIEHTLKGLLSGFREQQEKELYLMHYDWLEKFVKDIVEGNVDFANNINSKREQVMHDTLNKEPRIAPPIPLYSITFKKAGEEPIDISYDEQVFGIVKEAINSFEPNDDVVKRRDFENHLLKYNPEFKLDGRKREVWGVVRKVGTNINPNLKYKY